MKNLSVLLIISAVFLSACTSSDWVRTTVAKEYDFIVTLEQQPKEGNTALQKYEHPYQTDLASLGKLMGDLRYSEEAGLMSSEKQSPVFQAVEIDRLAPVLADALAKADASQRIRFTSFNQGKALLFTVSRKTEGVIFIESGGRLNLAFNSINSDRHPSETTAFYANISKVDPLKIKTSDTPISSIAPYAELHKFETGKQAPMWVVANLEKMKEAISTATVANVEATKEVPPAVVPEAGTMRTPAEKIAQGQTAQDKLKADIRNKLKYLKELRDEELISEQDYNSKKMELLDKIN